MVAGGVAATGAITVGAAGLAGTAGTPGPPGTAGTAGIAAAEGLGTDGDSAETLLVRRDALLSRGFTVCVEDCFRPPAAGSISSSQAPQL